MKIELVDGKPYQVCQWSRSYLKHRYGIRKLNGIREGSFANAACAVAYFTDLFERQKIDKEKFVRICHCISQDLNLASKDKKLCRAPRIDPANPDWNFMKQMPWMDNPAAHISAEEDYEVKQKKRREKEKN